MDGADGKSPRRGLSGPGARALTEQRGLPPGLFVRRAAPRDLEQLYALGRSSFPAESWSEDGLREELARESAICEIAEVSGDGAVGYLVAWQILDEVHLLQIATHPGWRRRGVGAHLLDRLLCFSREVGARAIFLEVRASNEAARVLYQSRGFATVGLRRGYYRAPVEDALVMAWTGTISAG